MKPFAFLFALFILGSIVSEKAHAENTQGLAVSPAFQEVSFDADQSQVDFTVTLTNTTGQSVTVRPSIVDFGSLDESGGVAFLGQTKDIGQKYALASWMHPEKDALFLENGETETLRMVIENRESLSPGGHYASILFRIGDGEEDLSSQNSVAVEQMLSVLVLAKKKGGEVYCLHLTEEQWSKNPFLLPSEARLRFQNEGNVHMVPRGVIHLIDPLGREVQKGIINPESSFLLPETLRTYTVALRKEALVFLPGFYTLSIEYRYDGEEAFTLRQDKRFFLPWPTLLVGVGFIGGIFFWLRRKKKMALS